MPFTAGLSLSPDTDRAAAAACAAVEAGLGGAAPELAAVFFSPHHANRAAALVREIVDRIRPGCLIGCMGESIVGTGQEIEGEPAVSLWAADFGGQLKIESFHLQPTKTPDGPSLLGLPDSLEERNPNEAALLVLGDPWTFPVADLFLPRLQEDHPGLPVMGGMASGSTAPGRTVLVKDGEMVNAGAVGVLLRGAPRWRSVVSQGCRPVGRPLVITKGRDNVIFAVGGQPPLEYLKELHAELPEPERGLLETGLHVGMVMSEYRESFGRGDFLVRNIYGFDRDSGAVVITDRVRVGQTIQFHIRDAATADEDLRSMLRADRAKHSTAGGALVFTCNGRGTRLFAEPNHDAAAIEREVGPIPTAGFFAAGELGPVGGRNFVHGFTASVVLFG